MAVIPQTAQITKSIRRRRISWFGLAAVLLTLILAAVFFSPLIAARPGGLSAGLRGPDGVGDAKGGKRG